MTTLLPAPPSETAQERRRRTQLRVSPAVLGLGLALLVWAFPLTHGAGGRDPWVLGLALVCLVPALAVIRPWRVLPPWQVGLAVLPAAVAVLVCLTAPTGWDGLDELATLAYAGLLALAVRAWATTGLRRRAILAGLALVGLEQFVQAYVPWWGGGSVSKLMVGTFYWHNQLSAFLTATGVVAGVLAVRGSGWLRVTGWLAAPWCLAGLLFAGSRAGLATFVVVWAVVVVMAFLDRRGRAAAFAVLGAALAVATLLSSPLMMSDGGWPFETLEAREAEQSAEGNGRARLAYWEIAAGLGRDHAVTGAGFDSFSGASWRLPPGAGVATHVHNGYLQAFSDGGVPLLLALTLATGVPLVAAFRSLLQRARRRTDDVVHVAVPVALLSLVLHSGVDFDWSYPALLALLGILAGLAGDPPRPPDRRSGASIASRAAAAAVCCLLVISVPAAIRASGLATPEADVPAWAMPVTAVVPATGHVAWLPAASVCRTMLLGEDREALRAALPCTSRAAAENPSLQMLRARALVVTGRKRAGVQLAADVVATYGERRPMLLLSQAAVLVAAEQPALAREVLVALQRRLASEGTDAARALVADALRGLDAATAAASTGSARASRWNRGAEANPPGAPTSTRGEGA